MEFPRRRTIIPNSIVSFFIAYQLFFGLDFGFSALLAKRFKFTIGLITDSMAVIYILGNIRITHITDLIWFWDTLVEYTACVIILKMSEYTLVDFIKEANKVYKLNNSERRTFNVICVVNALVMIVIKIVIYVSRCLYAVGYCQQFNLFYFVFNRLASIGVDIIGIIQTVIHFYVFCCVRGLKENYKSNNLDLDIFEKKYKDIATCYDTIRPLNDKFTFINICFGTPKMMAWCWFMLHSIQINAQWYWYTYDMISLMDTALKIISPAVMTELVGAQIDELKLILTEQISSDEDSQRVARLSRLLRYIKVRRVQHYAWRVIPPGKRQLIALSSFCITYIIIIVQFTHLYD